MERFGPRSVAIAGGILSTAGLVVTTLITESWHLILTFGVLTGM